MGSLEVIQIGRELLVTALMVALPSVLVSLAVGLVVSVFQTLTSIQEQTLNFVPRIIAVALVFIVTLPWTLKVLVDFTHRILWQMSEAGR